jgi:hypothetical protein
VSSWEQRRQRRAIDRLIREAGRLDRRSRMSWSAGARSRRSVDWHGVATLSVAVVLVAGLLIVMPGLVPAQFRGLIRSAAGSTGDGSYAFLEHQSGDPEDPVAWDPCRPIRYVVNPDGGPSGAIAFVAEAVSRVEEASGLTFKYVGETNERPNWDSPVRPSVGSEMPVLISWADSDEVPELAGDVAGLGGSVPVSGPSGRARYVAGGATLDSDTYDHLAHERGGEAAGRAILLHELGHVLGLAHVEDPGELMNSDNLGLRDFGPGDLTGLEKLGHVACF